MRLGGTPESVRPRPRVTPHQRKLSRMLGGSYFHGETFVPRYVCGPWNTNEAGEVAARAGRLRLAENNSLTPFRGLAIQTGSSGTGGFRHFERPLPKWIAKLVKRNTLYFHSSLVFGLSLGFVNRWKVVYADTFIQDWSRLIGHHPIRVAEDFVKKGREIVRTGPGSDAE